MKARIRHPGLPRHVQNHRFVCCPRLLSPVPGATEKTEMLKPPDLITSLSNPKIKEAVKLREGKYRRRTKKFVIDGIRELDRAIQAGIRILEIFTVHPQLSHKNIPHKNIFCKNIPCKSIIIRQVTESVFRKISYGDREDGIVAVAEEPVWTFEAFESAMRQSAKNHSAQHHSAQHHSALHRPAPLLAVVEKVSKPGNLGAVFRSADAAGFDGVMIADLHLDPFHYNAIRSSLGTVFHVPSVCDSSENICRWLKEQQFQIAAAWCSGNTIPYTSMDFCRPTAIVLGSEAEGLSSLWNGAGITGITLPMHGAADSLNISVAAGILFYEARRQRML